MKKIYNLIVILILLLNTSCESFLDVPPVGKLPAEELFKTKAGVQAYLANLYGDLPIEDFTYSPHYGFMKDDDTKLHGIYASSLSNESVSAIAGVNYITVSDESILYWDAAYPLIRRINNLIDIVPDFPFFTQKEKDELIGEAHFLRAYTYFNLAKRYGGVPIIKKIQEFNGDINELIIPRSTERATWDFILEDCDKAFSLLGSDNKSSVTRANGWTALALKSRAALYAASVAKYTQGVGLGGPAIQQKLAGMSPTEANHFYDACISSSLKLIKDGGFSLHKAEPNTPDEALVNYQDLFENAKSHLNGGEIIFAKLYEENTALRHSWDIWTSPRQIIKQSHLYPGRTNPTLDFVESFEEYSNDGIRNAPKIKTRQDGNEDLYKITGEDFNANDQYIYYDKESPYDAFANRDARLAAQVVLPGSSWGTTPIVMQGGLVTTDGRMMYLVQGEATKQIDGKNKTFYTYGGADPYSYSGFDPTNGTYSRSGFLLRKHIQIKQPCRQDWRQCYQPWIEMRYAEVLLNLAEAAVEKTNATADELKEAEKALNSIRRRAAHMDNIPLSLENVLLERKVELAFENKAFWDLYRRRENTKVFSGKKYEILVPILDLRPETPKYFFYRAYVAPTAYNPIHANRDWYYQGIPGTGNNGAVQNP